MEAHWPEFEAKMRAEGLDASAIAAFKHNYSVLASGARTTIAEASILPVGTLPDLASIKIRPKPALLRKTVMVKLNGGLGTGMGLDRAKSLLPVRGEETFLDLIARQVEWMRDEFGARDLAFMLMNSFSTSEDTLARLRARHPSLGAGADLEFLQNKAPKVDAATLRPASWPAEPSHEWCPPGHGDLYAALQGSGTLDRLLGRGIRYMFVSNSDNLGATMDLTLLTHFARSRAPFMMEVAQRTHADRKGGHLARDARTGALLLRESAQCAAEDEAAFQDVSRHRYFNTNNLWIDLVALKAALRRSGGALPLPVITNAKTVDPRDKASAKVLQLETAMGSAISCFKGAIAIAIPRTRFAPVKTTADLLALRSDAYVLTRELRVELAPERAGAPPMIELDARYKFVEALDALGAVPSLVRCSRLVLEGALEFEPGVVIVGDVTIASVARGGGSRRARVRSGEYENVRVEVGKGLLTAGSSSAAGSGCQVS